MSYEGTVVLNYRLAKKLGEGGFGTVYLAEHTDLGRKAACKILHREFAGKPEVVERFFREAKAVCAIGHRAIIDIENFGALPTGEPFYLMEYFPGESLADRAQRGPLQPAQLVAIFDAVTSALSAAHAKQIIHRDLKPENIMVLAGDDGAITDVKLLDFGIAKLVGDRDSVRSRSGTSMGTPSYMSPEQALDAKSVDVRTDVYSLAATIYTAIAGQPPFIGDSVAVLLKVQTEPPPPLTKLVPSAPIAVERALAHCLVKHPDGRPATIAAAWREIRDALATAGPFERSAASVPAVAPTLPPDAATEAPASTVALRKQVSPMPGTTLGAAASESMPVPARSRRGIAIVAALAAIAIITVVAIAVTREKGESSTVAATTPPPPVVPDAAVLVDAPAIAPEPIDAAEAVVAIDAGTKRDKPRPKPTPVPTPGSGSVQPPPPQPPPPPVLVCSTASFAAIYTQPSPSEADVKTALGRLNKCRGQLAPDTFAQIQKNLVAKL